MVKLNQMFTPVLNDPLIPMCRREGCEFPAVVWGEDVPLCFAHAFEEATAAIFRHGREATAKNRHPMGNDVFDAGSSANALAKKAASAAEALRDQLGAVDGESRIVVPWTP